MKKGPKKILGRLTIVDILIILCVVGAVVFAFIHINSDNDNVQSISFDSSTTNKLAEKYLSFYRDGQIVKSHVAGYNASSGQYQEIYGEVVWVDDSISTNLKVLLNVDGTLVLTGLYKDIKNADIYLEQITLETDGSKYKNVTDITIYPMEISKLSDIYKNIPNDTNYTIETVIGTNTLDGSLVQNIYNQLLEKTKRQSIFISGNKDKIELNMATKEDLLIENEILGSFKGQSDFIIIRIYNSTPKDIEAIKSKYHIKNIEYVT